MTAPSSGACRGEPCGSTAARCASSTRDTPRSMRCRRRSSPPRRLNKRGPTSGSPARRCGCARGSRHGTNLMPAIFDQRRIALDPDASPWTTLTGDAGDTVFVQGRPRHAASYLKDFLFEERQFKAKVATLSGGERNRLLLAKVLAQP